MIDRFRLPFAVDVQALRADLDRLGQGGWIPHFNREYYAGDWSGLTLRGGPDQGHSLYIGPDSCTGEDTPVMAQCHGIRAMLKALDLEVRSVRLLRLGAGAEIREHRDYGLGVDGGEARLHVPIITHPAVEFRLRNQRVDMRPGEVWYLDLSQPHRVRNASTVDRIHLVMDVAADDRLRRLVPFDQPDPEVLIRTALVDGTCQEVRFSNFVRFHEAVLTDRALHAELAAISDRSLFLDEAVRLGVKHGFPFSVSEVQSAMVGGRRRWNQL